MTDPVIDAQSQADREPLILDEFERRVLGVLLEKSLAQPSYYPMTLNSIVAACNQKSNRDPVMDLDNDTVWKTLTELRERGLVTQMMPSAGQRTEKYRHEAHEALGWERRERAIMAELLLRGAQTVGELRTRCSRMLPFESIEAVTIVIDLLCGRTPPFVRMLPRSPGQSAVRYDHCVYPADEQPPLRAGTTVSTVPPVRDAAQASRTAQHDDEGLQDLRSELKNAHADITELRETVNELQRRVETLEQLMS